VTIYRDPSGMWIGEFRRKGKRRLKLSMRTDKKAEARDRHDVVQRAYREDREALLDLLREETLSVEELTRRALEGETFAAIAAAAAPVVNTEPKSLWPQLGDAIEQYLLAIQSNENRAHATFMTARSQLRKFAAFAWDGEALAIRAVDRIPSAAVEAYQRSLLDGDHEANTRSSYMKRIAALYAWLRRREGRLANEEQRLPRFLYSPVDPDTLTRDTTSRDRFLTEPEAERLLAATPPQLLAAVGLGLFAGLRRGEILNLRPWLDVDLDRSIITIQARPGWRPKTKRAARVVPITAPLHTLLEAHLERYASQGWLFPSPEDATRPMSTETIWRHFGAIVVDAELVAGRSDPNGVTLHTLRHTFASWLVMNEVDLYTVAQLLGDTLAVVERTYAHLAPEFKARAVARLAGIVKLPAPDDGTESAETATESATAHAST
jgi:integrase